MSWVQKFDRAVEALIKYLIKYWQQVFVENWSPGFWLDHASTLIKTRDVNSNGIRGIHRSLSLAAVSFTVPRLSKLFMILHYRSTNYNPQIAAGVYNAAALSAHTRIREPRRASLVVKANTMHSPSHAMRCALSKHVSVETIVYNVSEESNLLARRSRTLCSVYSIKRKTRKNERERGRKGQGW